MVEVSTRTPRRPSGSETPVLRLAHPMTCEKPAIRRVPRTPAGAVPERSLGPARMRS